MDGRVSMASLPEESHLPGFVAGSDDGEMLFFPLFFTEEEQANLKEVY